VQHYAEEVKAVNWRNRFETEFLSGFCLLTKRQVVDDIGGFDEQFLIGNYEDDDYCLRAQLAGYKLLVAQDTYVHHFGSATFQGENIDFSEQLQSNWELFKKKWKLPEDLEPPSQSRYNYDKWIKQQGSKKDLYISPSKHNMQEKLISVLFFIDQGDLEQITQSKKVWKNNTIETLKLFFLTINQLLQTNLSFKIRIGLSKLYIYVHSERKQSQTHC
jgi:cellulose synthase/poly-beta-1,6-N-acetylglucosamine synthase-like glycosyltransferase